MGNINQIFSILYKVDSTSFYVYVILGVLSLLVLFGLSIFSFVKNIKKEKIKKLEEETLKNIKTISIEDEEQEVEKEIINEEKEFENRYINVYLEEVQIPDEENQGTIIDLDDEVIKLDKDDFLNKLNQMKLEKEK